MEHGQKSIERRVKYAQIPQQCHAEYNSDLEPVTLLVLLRMLNGHIPLRIYTIWSSEAAVIVLTSDIATSPQRCRHFILGSWITKLPVIRQIIQNSWSSSPWCSEKYNSNGRQIAVNTLLLCGSLIVFGLHCLLYGPFEPAESEELYARFVPATLESIMTVIILDIDVDIEFLLLFTALLAGRMWVWIGEWRVDSLRLERTTRMPTYVCVLIAVLLPLTFEMFMLGRIFHAAQRTTDAKVVVMFGFEHTIVSISAMSTTLSFFSLREEAFMRNPSEERKDKRRAMFSLNAITGKHNCHVQSTASRNLALLISFRVRSAVYQRILPSCLPCLL